MDHKKLIKRKLYRTFKSKFRMVIMNDATLEEKASFILSPMNIFVTFVISTIVFVAIIVSVIAFTDLREYIPGYADVTMRKQMIALKYKADSLQTSMANKDTYIKNIVSIIAGNDTTLSDNTTKDTVAKIKSNIHYASSKEDSVLRAEVEQEDMFNITQNPSANNAANASSVSGFFFFSPLHGTITDSYDAKKKHFGVDIVAPENEPIKSVLDGTVIIATWTLETGYLICIQHSNNLFSLYKHNSVLLKQEGDIVKAGEPIAIIGNTGEITTGPHLHFELWFNGYALNPEDYMTF